MLLLAGFRSGSGARGRVRHRWSRRPADRWLIDVQCGRGAAPGASSARTGRPARPTGQSPADRPG